MVGPHVRGRSGTAALQPAASLAARADGGALLGAGFAYRPAAPRVTGHRLWRSQPAAPLRPIGGVGDLDAGVLEPIPDLVGQRPVALLARLLPAFQFGLHQHVDRGQRGRRLVARFPALVERIAAEDAHHRPDRCGVFQGAVVVARVERSVALRAGVVHLGQRRRHRQIVVECGGEPRRPLPGHDGTDPGAHPVQELLDSDIGFDRVLQGRLGEFQHRPVVGAAQVVAQFGRRGPAAASPGWTARCPATCSSSRRPWSPSRCAASSGRTRRRPRGSARFRSRDAGRPNPFHRNGCRIPGRDRCGPSPSIRDASRAVPVPTAWAMTARRAFAPFHSVKSRWSRLPVADALALVDVVDPVPGQLAVLRVAEHVEVDVAATGVGVASFDQALH